MIEIIEIEVIEVTIEVIGFMIEVTILIFDLKSPNV